MSHSLTGTATAYCLSGTTSTGSTTGPGTIAVNPKVIPYHKQGDKGKQNLFLKSEIDEWILTRGRKADYMIEEEALAYVNSKRG